MILRKDSGIGQAASGKNRMGLKVPALIHFPVFEKTSRRLTKQGSRFMIMVVNREKDKYTCLFLYSMV